MLFVPLLTWRQPRLHIPRTRRRCRTRRSVSSRSSRNALHIHLERRTLPTYVVGSQLRLGIVVRMRNCTHRRASSSHPSAANSVQLILTALVYRWQHSSPQRRRHHRARSGDVRGHLILRQLRYERDYGLIRVLWLVSYYSSCGGRSIASITLRVCGVMY